jgi:hypothetical protein
VRAANPGLRWREIAGMRNKLMHEYFGVNAKVVWCTLPEDLPGLIPLLRNMLEGQGSSAFLFVTPARSIHSSMTPIGWPAILPVPLPAILCSRSLQWHTT